MGAIVVPTLDTLKAMGCQACVYWLHIKWSDDGLCQRHAPLLPLTIRMDSGYHNKVNPEWPTTRKGDWCGDFQLKSEKEGTE